MTAAMNQLLDRLPRTRFGSSARQVPAFRTCGVTGFYFAVAAALGGGLIAGRSLPVVAALCLVCALSFFAYTYLRRWATGHEKLVLLEHVWFAEACVAGAVWALGEPVGAYLDVIAPAMAIFLAWGRTGCLLVGCCHGHPSSLGIVYPERHVRDGFPGHLVGVRLFPVQALEAAGLVAISVTGLLALPFAAPGRVFAWFLAAYAVLRFGTESLRGDERPHLLGLSVPRWMSLAELALALWLCRGEALPGRDLALLGFLLAGLAAALAARRYFDARPALLAPVHLAELRGAVAAAGEASRSAPGRVALRTTSLGVRVGASVANGDGGTGLHLSLSLPDDRRDLPLLCEVAAHALPGARLETGHASTAGVLHLFAVHEGQGSGSTSDAARRARDLYGAVARQLQHEDAEGSAPPPAPDAVRRDYFEGRMPDRRAAGAH